MTSNNPYPCETAHVQSLVIDKSLTVMSYHAPAHLSCSYGIKINGEARNSSVTVTLRGLVFTRMHLDFEGHSLRIVDCSFKNCIRAVSVVLNEESSVTKINVADSLFLGNSGCLLVDIQTGYSCKPKLDLFIGNTTFQVNEALSSLDNTRAILSIRCNVNSYGSRNNVTAVLLSINFQQIRFYQNKGGLIEVRLPLQGLTEEVYKDVQFVGNYAAVNSTTLTSLYTSQANRSTVRFQHSTFKDNANVRCIDISSPEVVLDVHGCLFAGRDEFRGNGGALNIVADQSTNIFVSNSSFSDFYSSSLGGAVYVSGVYLSDRKLNLSMRYVTFRNSVSRNGAAMYILGGKKSLDQVIDFDNVFVFNCSCSDAGVLWLCGILYFDTEGRAAINITNSSWQSNKGNMFGPSAGIRGNGGRDARILISNVSFIKNSVALQLWSFGKVEVESSVVSANMPGGMPTVFLRQQKYTSFQRVTFRKPANDLSIWLSQTEPLVTVSISNCTFEDGLWVSGYGLGSNGNLQRQLQHFELYDSTFSGWGDVIRFQLSFGKIPVDTNMILSNVTVGPSTYQRKHSSDATKGSALTLLCNGASDVTLQIKNSTFRNTYNVDIRFTERPPLSPGCKKKYPKWNQTNFVIIENTLFEGNFGNDAGALFVQNAHTTLKQCKFKDNFSVRGAHIYLAQGSASLDIQSTVFLQSSLDVSQYNSFIYSDSQNSLVLRNTTLRSHPVSNVDHLLTISGGGYFSINESSTIMCSVGGMLQLNNLSRIMETLYRGKLCEVNVTIFTISCRICDTGYYSLQRGTSNGLAIEGKFTCIPCPYGATCTKNIKAKIGFWGSTMKSNTTSLVFNPCPFGYCSSPPLRMLRKPLYNYCKGKRAGRLCGVCRGGYTDSLVSSTCVDNKNCSSYWYLLAAAFLALIMAIYLIRKPPIIPFLTNQVLWFRPRPNTRSVGNQANGYIKVLFYFYQVANLLLIENTAMNVLRNHYVITVMKLFNFQLSNSEGKLSNFGCPIRGLDAVTKELIPAAGVVEVFICIVLLYFLHRVYRTVRRIRPPSAAPYTAAAVETALLGHVSLANASLKLLNCVSIGTERVLFIDGEVECWQYWQTGVVLFTACYLIPFVIILGIGARRLIQGCITVHQFLVACLFPLPSLVYWLISYFRAKERTDNQVEHPTKEAVLAVLTGPFRIATEHNRGTVYWESVLIGRRLTLAALHSFIPQHLPRYLALQSTCLLIYVHHSSVYPYQNSQINQLESVSLLSHVVIATFSIGHAALSSVGAIPEGPNEILFEALDWITAVILGFVPVVFAVFVLLAIVSQIIRLLYKSAKYLYQHCTARYNRSIPTLDEQRTRLLKEPVTDSSYSR